MGKKIVCLSCKEILWYEGKGYNSCCAYCRDVMKWQMAEFIRENRTKVLGHRQRVDIPDFDLKSNKTHRELAKKYRCSYSTVYRRRRELRERELRERERECSQVPMLGGGDFRRF